MSEFAKHRHDLTDSAGQFAEIFHNSASLFMKEFDDKANAFLAGMRDAEARVEEQIVTISSQNETIKSLQDEIDRITTDYELRIDSMHAEITALRSAAATKDNEFGALSRANRAMMTAAQSIISAGAYGFNIINRDRVADKIVTDLRQPPSGRPQRRPRGPLSSVLAAAGEDLPSERQVV